MASMPSDFPASDWNCKEDANMAMLLRKSTRTFVAIFLSTNTMHLISFTSLHSLINPSKKSMSSITEHNHSLCCQMFGSRKGPQEKVKKTRKHLGCPEVPNTLYSDHFLSVDEFHKSI
jgi:hypothetical protein